MSILMDLKTFHSHMLISGGNNALKCKMFIGTLLGVALDWFSGINNRLIIGFEDFSYQFVIVYGEQAKDVDYGRFF